MKNFGLFILGVVLGALVVYFYCCNDFGVTDPPEVLEPKGLITPKEAMVLDEAYNLRYNIINDSLFKNSETGDNRSSWWSIENIKNYIDYAENQAGELGYTLDGLRLYLGAHPDLDGEIGLTTMFFIPTGTKNISQGNLFPSLQIGSGDIPGGDGLNFGQNGVPPDANYPQ